MSIETTILLSNISTESLGLGFEYSNKQKGAGYHKNNDGLHTVVYEFNEFAGTVKIQATLELYPGESDWFDVEGTELGGDSTLINSSSLSHTFTGKFVWIRAAYNVQDGTITQIRYNY